MPGRFRDFEEPMKLLQRDGSGLPGPSLAFLHESLAGGSQVADSAGAAGRPPDLS